MKTKIKILGFALFSVILFCFISDTAKAQKQYAYKTVTGDPLKARIYTLDNGLSVYMTVYKDAPRIQTYIAVRAGSKNDPSDATGLAHYFEHLMFKGSKSFGSVNYSKEEPFLDQIDSLFEVYRVTKDSSKRLNIYHRIDSVSTLAAQFAIPNEYDKLVGLIGATGTNAYTSNDQTVYVNDIPSNELENWLNIESDRFSNNVIRLFHTELETVYEEKNMTLANDQRKATQALFEGLFNNHPYGTQTTIGTIEHLKSPSIKKIKDYYNKYYVANNMAICLSGDFDPDETIKLIDKYFGTFSKKEIPAFTFKPEESITSPIIKEVEGPDSENINIAFRFKGAGSKDSDILMLLDMILSNSTAGLIDLNLVQKQKVLSATSGVWELKDYSLELLSGKPKENQTLQEVKDLLLEQVELIKKGEFTDWLIPAIINDLKLMQMKSYEDNNSRASAFVNAFVMGIPWENKVTLFERLSKITKQEVIDFAKANFTEKNYVVVYKKTGTDKSIVKIKKPKITPIKINRTDQSTFYKTIESSKVPDVEPVFLDYSKDIATLKAKSNIELLYKENTENKTFDLIYVFKMGNNNSKKWGIALKYLEYLGTSKYTAEEIKQEFYKIACTYKISVGDEETYLNISGLSENIDRAFELFESILSEPKADKASLDNFISDIIKKRKDAKLNKQNIQMALRSYGIWGPNGPFKNKLSEAELKTLTPEELVAIIKEANSYEHHILYYGSHSKDEIINLVNIYHKVPAVLTAVPLATKFVQQPTDKNIIYHVDFAMKQADIFMLNRGGLYDKSTEATVNLFNEYFGGSMNSIVFQELREARALAYTAQSVYSKPKYLDRYYYSFSYIGTQTDKLAEAMNGLLDLMNKMPEAEKSFEIAKSSIIQQMRTERITKSDVLYSYESARKLGLNYDIRKDVFTQLPKLTFADIKAFEEKNLKDKPHTTLILADKKILDFKLLKKYGKVKYLKLEDVFGY